MRNFIIIIIYFILYTPICYGQENLDVNIERIIINKTDYNMQFYVCKNCSTNVDINLYYYWLKANEVLKTKGGYEGKLLHGLYSDYYLSKNLKSKGSFNLGLKNGEWVEWYENGEIKEIYNWKSGKLHGKFIQYSDKGKMNKEGAYKKGLLNGTVKIITNDTTSVIKYKNGVQIVEKSDPFKNIKIYKIKKKKPDENIDKKEEPIVPNVKPENLKTI